jgi:hypothetical protein
VRRILVVALALIVLAGALGGVAATRRFAIAEWWLQRRIAALGVEPAALRVTRLDARGIALADVALGSPDAPDLGVARVEADWSWRALREGRFDALRVDGAALRATLTDDGVSLGSLDPLLGGGGGGTLALPAASIEIDAARLRVATPQGSAEGTFGGTLDAAPDGVAGRFALAVAGAGLRAKGELEVGGTLAAPSFRGWLTPSGAGPLTGRVESHGSVTGGAFEAKVALRDVALTLPGVRVEGVHAVIAVAGPPLHTPAGQLVSFARVHAGIPLGGGVVRFALRRDGTLAVESASIGFAGGELGVDAFRFDPDARRTPLTARARDLDLAVLLERVALPGLAGTGRVESELPLVRESSSIRVESGVLRTTGPGTLRYQPSESVRALAASRPADLGLAVDAFSNFQYELLEAKLDGELTGAMQIALHVRGVNPGFQDGRPIELNLSLDAHLADLVRAGTASYRVPHEIEERLRAFQEESKRP